MLSLTLAPDRFASLEQLQLDVHLMGRSEALAGIALTGGQNNLVKLQQPISVGLLRYIDRQFGKIQAVFARARFVQDLAQTVEIGLTGPGPLGWNETLGSDECLGFG